MPRDVAATIVPTMALDDAAREVWPAVVVGAGPAGAMAARELARRKIRVLLVDKATFPRQKVCGGCLGRAAIDLLRDCGLQHLPYELGAQPTRSLRLHAGGRSASLAVPTGLAVSREVFDAALVREAIAAGAHFLDGATARLGAAEPECRQVRLRVGPREVVISARLILAADGLAGVLLAGHDELRPYVASNSRLGLGAIVDSREAAIEPGIIHMFFAPSGYLGLVRVEDDRLSVAAALNADFVRQAGGPAAAAVKHLVHAGLPEIGALADATWHATPALTRKRPQLAAERVFVIGDAAGYIEPFTGEGMTWALASGQAVIPAALTAIETWSPEIGDRWESLHRRLIQHRQWVCVLVTGLLRHQIAARGMVRLLSHFPWLASPATRQVSRKFRLTP